jgi:hypothetical protein
MSASLDEIESWVGEPLPEPYRTFLAGHPDELAVGDRVVLYGRASFIELNEANEVRTYAPGCVTIGDDSGGRQVLLALRNGRLGLVDAGSMSPTNAYPLADRFDDWLAGGCDLRDPPTERHPERIDIYLLRPPAEGLKGLVRVLKLLDQTVPVSEYRAILSGTPYRLLRDAPYLPYSWRSAEYNQLDPCLGACEVDRPDQPVRITPRDTVPPPPPGLDLS